MQPDTIKELIAMEDGLPAEEGSGLFGGNIPEDDAGLVVIPVPWEPTTSYGRGTAKGPEAVLAASHQLDLVDRVFGAPYWEGITMLPVDSDVVAWNESTTTAADQVIDAWSKNQFPQACEDALHQVNHTSERLNEWVYNQARRRLDQGKLVAVLGGDHSCPLGLMRALAEKHPDGFGVLHIDAHLDLRKAYEGFKHSHASIMYNALEHIPEIKKLLSVAVRDYAAAEVAYGESQEHRVAFFSDGEIQEQLNQGLAFATMVEEFLRMLPEKVYVSFDIDGLDPSLCPHTGTPVPGGLTFGQVNYLLERLATSDRKIIGFDLCEVAGHEDDEWDANVGARMLYKLCGALLYSQAGQPIKSRRP